MKRTKVLNRLISDQCKNKFLYLMYFCLIRYLSNIPGIIFGIVFPIVWLIAAYYIWGQTYGPGYFINMYTSFSLLPAASLGLMSFPMNFGVDRISKMEKIYATLNINKITYLSANYLVVLLEFLIVTNIILLLGNFLFIGDVSHATTDLISANEYFAVMFTNVYTFSLCFIFSLGLSLIGKRANVLFTSVLIYYYISIFISGIVIPSYAYDPQSFKNPEANWFKWLQYITPIGSGSRLNENIVYPLAWTWKTDWLCFVSPIAQASIIAYLVYKLSSWRFVSTVGFKNCCVSKVKGLIKNHK